MTKGKSWKFLVGLEVPLSFAPHCLQSWLNSDLFSVDSRSHLGRRGWSE